MASHAYLAASASERWISCPPSAKLCSQVEDQSSLYAQEGTDAHSLCQYLLELALGRHSRDPTDNLTFYNAEMQEAAEGYAAFVMEQLAEVKQHCPDPLVCVEQTVDFSKWVEHGFGTADAAIVADGMLYVTDMKYGLGVLVSAAGEDGNGNSQLKCYALGLLDTFGSLYDIRRVRLTIYQPRRQNVDSYELSTEELLRWAEEVLKPAAKLAYVGDGNFSAGTHCRFCKVRATCRARAEYSMQLAKYDFEDPPLLTESEIAEILPRIDTLQAWADDVRAYALKQALAGTQYPGFKLVEGRSNRRYTNEEAVARAVLEAGYDPFEQKLLGISAMTKQLGQKKFNEILKGLVEKPQGKPVLVPDSDRRPAYSTASSDFTEE